MPVSQIQNASLASGVPGRANLPTGSVLQVVYGSSTTSTATSGGPVDTTLTATITPTSATSRIAVFITQEFYLSAGGSDVGAIFTLLRNGSSLISVSFHSVYIFTSSGTAELIGNHPLNYVDSPASTSALTYKTQVQATAGGTVTTQWNSNLSTIILMEIAS